MSQYVIEFTSKAEQLTETGIDIPEELLSVMLLGSLPAEFENFSVAIESRDDIPSFENLKLKLVEEEARQIDRVIPSNQDCNSNSALVTKGRRTNKKTDTQKPNLKCYNCGKMGHKSRVCWSKPKNDGKNKNNENGAMLTNSRTRGTSTVEPQGTCAETEQASWTSMNVNNRKCIPQQIIS
jgi:hypothetical protein